MVFEEKGSGYMAVATHVFSDDLQVCLRIYEFNRRNEKIWFKKLVEEMDGVPTGPVISRSLDKLFDRGMIDGEWENVDGCWTRTLKVTDGSVGFIRGLYNIVGTPDGREVRDATGRCVARWERRRRGC